jgi:hypothetical protein
MQERLQRDPLVDPAGDAAADLREVVAVALDLAGEDLAEQARGLDRQRLEVARDLAARPVVVGDLDPDAPRHRLADRAMPAQQDGADLADSLLVGGRRVDQAILRSEMPMLVRSDEETSARRRDADFINQARPATETFRGGTRWTKQR